MKHLKPIVLLQDTDKPDSYYNGSRHIRKTKTTGGGENYYVYLITL